MEENQQVSNQAAAKIAMRQEYIKCAVDPAHFMRKYCMIQHPIKGTISFNLYEFQGKVLHLLQNNNYSLILKSRQLGISTLSAGYALWLMVFNNDKNVLVLATKQETAKNMVTKVKFMYENLPAWLRGNKKPQEANKLTLKLANGSQIKAVSAAGDSGRSEAVSLLIIDEAAFIDGVEEIWASSQQTLSTGGGAIVLSCVTKDTYVYTDNGIKKIENFYKNPESEEDYRIDQYNILGKDKLRKGELFHNNGKTKTKIINSVYSYLEGSFNHKVYGYSSNNNTYDWMRLDELSEGDYVAVQYGMNIWGNNNDVSLFQPSISNKIKIKYNPSLIDANIAYLIGLYISEGSSYINKNEYGNVVGGNITITCGDDISKSITKCGLNYSSHDKLHYTVSSKNLIEFYQYLGFDLSKKAKEKIIPERVLEMSKDNIIQMLRGIFDGDGSVMKKKNNLRVSIGLSSKELILQLRVILLNLGILPTYQETITKITKKVKVVSNSYRLDISGKQAEKFCDIIGFNLDRKISIYENHNKKDDIRTGVLDIIPGYSDIFSKIKDNSKLGLHSLNNKTGISLSRIGSTKSLLSLSRTNALKIKESLEEYFDKDILDFYSKNINENIIWSKVSSIKESENYTYDFSLPETDNEWCHSVIYNGIVGHQTPNGIGNWFHQMWEKAELSENNFLPIKLRWDVHPDRDISWRRQQDDDLGVKLASQECDAEFLASGDTAFESDDLAYYEKNVIQPINKRGQEGNLWIFEEADYKKDYMVVADVARGDGKDFSACHVIEIESMRQVAEYKSHIQTPDYANFLYALGTEYNDAMLVVENSSIGWDVITRLLERGYKNFYYSPKTDILTQEEWVSRFNNPNNFTPGFVNSLKTRPLIIEKFREYVSKRQVVINSPRLVSEMRTFIWKNGRAEAQSGYNDDLVMSMAIGLYLRDTAVRFRKANLDLTKNALDNFSVNRGYTDQNSQQADGGFGIYSGTSMNDNSLLQQYKDNSWLF